MTSNNYGLDYWNKTPQEVFDFVVNHLIEQGGPARDDEGDCQYRTFDGKACAAGCLLPNNKWGMPGVPNNSWNVLVANSFVRPEHEDLIQDLQCAHDRSGTWLSKESGSFDSAFKSVADAHGLVYNP